KSSVSLGLERYLCCPVNVPLSEVVVPLVLPTHVPTNVAIVAFSCTVAEPLAPITKTASAPDSLTCSQMLAPSSLQVDTRQASSHAAKVSELLATSRLAETVSQFNAF